MGEIHERVEAQTSSVLLARLCMRNSQPQNPLDYGRLQPLQQKHLLLEAAILYATRYYIGLINCPEHVLLKEKYQRHNFTS